MSSHPGHWIISVAVVPAPSVPERGVSVVSMVVSPKNLPFSLGIERLKNQQLILSFFFIRVNLTCCRYPNWISALFHQLRLWDEVGTYLCENQSDAGRKSIAFFRELSF